jgi:hypothetical protein
MAETDKLSSHSHASRNVERSRYDTTRHRHDTSATRFGLVIIETHSLKFHVVMESAYVSVVGPLQVETRVEIPTSEYASDIAS